jgi:microsomal dipeptidase-like Zn-dependent dipeptidase
MTIDLHLDTLWKMTKYGSFQISEGIRYSDVSAVKLFEGQLDAAVFALYLAQHYEMDAERLVGEQIAYFKSQKWPEGFKPYLAMENGELLMRKLGNVEHYAKAGIVYLTLTHNYNNSLGGSATDKDNEGIKPFGCRVIKECERFGVIVDVSHASDLTATDAIMASRRPVIASHSGCRKLFDHPRNIPDTLITLIAQTGGLVGVPFVRNFIGTREAIANHIDHIVQLVGITHVAIGSDIDGAVMVDGVEMARWRDSFADGLVQRGYSHDDIVLIAGENFKRLLASASK